jgi:hypothetical protein
MLYGDEIGKICKDAHEEIYGKRNSIDSVFRGGNVGMIALGMLINDGAKDLAKAINRLSDALEHKQEGGNAE